MKEKARQREAEREQKRQSELEVKRKLQEEERALFELRTKANEGDPKARMELAPRFSAEYWEAYKDMEIENSSRYENSKFIRYVNGVSVYEDDFSNKVMFTIEERGHILSEMVRSSL